MRKIILCISFSIIILLSSCNKIGNYSAISSNSENVFSQTSLDEKTSYDLSNKIIENIDIATEIVSVPKNEKEYEEFCNSTEWFISEEYTWPNTEFPKLERSSNDIRVSGYYEENFPVVNNDIDNEDIIYPCDGQFIYNHYFHTEYSYATIISTQFSFGDDLNYPVAALRKTGDGKYYDIRKYRYGGYLYSFYDRFYNITTGQYSTEDETDITFIGGIYVENVLSYSDFKNIKIGNTIEEVEQVDSAVAMYMLCDKLDEKEDAFSSNDLMLKYKKDKAYSLHLLTDGLLTIHYDKKNGEYIVSDIVFSEDFIYESPYIEECFGNSYPKQFKILPQDYPPVS